MIFQFGVNPEDLMANGVKFLSAMNEIEDNFEVTINLVTGWIAIRTTSKNLTREKLEKIIKKFCEIKNSNIHDKV